MYELCSALSGLRTQEAVAHTLAQQLQQLFQASLVKVIFQANKQLPSTVISVPPDGVGKGRPDRVLPILNVWGMIGEIQVWRGDYVELPPEESHLLQNFASQTAKALERTQVTEAGDHIKGLAPTASAK
jgi:K+-sensing histidine kinase KdpD